MMYLSFSPAVDRDAFLLSFSMVSMAEIFDKTWFVALVMAMRHEKNTVFWGCFAGLLIHVFIAAAFGWSVAQLLSPRVLDFLAASLYGLFTVLYAYDWYTTEKDSDLISAGREEVEEACPLAADPACVGALKGGARAAGKSYVPRVFWQCFMAVFIAEWGDRTQIAMIGIHASQPLIPVMLGSSVAFALLTLSAVLMGVFLGNRTLSESTVKAVCALSFALFTGIAIHDGMNAPPLHAATAHQIV